MTAQIEDLRVAIEYMALSVRRGNERRFVVMLSEYEIEGTVYRASLLTISPDRMREIAATDTGFRCLALFPPDALTAQDRARGRLTDNGAVEVSLRVDHADVYLIQVETAPESGDFESLYG